VCERHEFYQENDFDICPVCGWENDGVQSSNHDYSGGANWLSVNKSKLVFSRLGESKIMVLATCTENRPTARSMSCIMLGGYIYLQTDRRFKKYEQIKNNPSIALCFDNVQIEAKAELCGHPLNPSNAKFAKAFEEHFKASFDAYSHLKDEVLIKCTTTKITFWEYIEGNAFRRTFDYENHREALEEYKA
jgi:uncharacterized pyridoxamine 5'-phosphate oxidase family protein